MEIQGLNFTLFGGIVTQTHIDADISGKQLKTVDLLNVRFSYFDEDHDTSFAPMCEALAVIPTLENLYISTNAMTLSIDDTQVFCSLLERNRSIINVMLGVLVESPYFYNLGVDPLSDLIAGNMSSLKTFTMLYTPFSMEHTMAIIEALRTNKTITCFGIVAQTVPAKLFQKMSEVLEDNIVLEKINFSEYGSTWTPIIQKKLARNKLIRQRQRASLQDLALEVYMNNYEQGVKR